MTRLEALWEALTVEMTRLSPKTGRDLKTLITKWFPSSHGGVSGIREVERKLSTVECVIEVHDARVPISGRNVDFLKRLRCARPHLLVLNKSDCISATAHEVIRRRLSPTEVVFVSATHREGVNLILPNTIRLIEDFFRENVEFAKPHHTVMIVGVPNVGKSSVINAVRELYTGLNNTATRVGALPGVTRRVLQTIRVSESPKVYLVDTPGVLEAKPVSTEAALRLALCGCALDHVVGVQLMAAYLLNFMQERQIHTYTEHMGLMDPTDSLRTLLETGARTLNAKQKVLNFRGPGYESTLNLDQAAAYFIDGFRRKRYGRILLDDEGDAEDAELANS